MIEVYEQWEHFGNISQFASEAEANAHLDQIEGDEDLLWAASDTRTVQGRAKTQGLDINLL